MENITFERIKNDEIIREYIRRADRNLAAMGYTKHSFGHVTKVAEGAAEILTALGYDERTVELARIAGFLHDIGNVVNRADHAQSGAIMAFQLLTGMGMPAIGIYSHELFNGYGVENIIRVGSAGAIQEHIHLYDLVIAQGACTDSNFAAQFHIPGTFAPIADFTLLETAVTVARKLGIEPHVGSLLSSDVFYNKAGNTLDWGKMGVLAVEMESAALYCNAAEAGKRALAICTISDSLITGEELPAADRQTTFTQMMEIALGVAVEMAKK